MTDNPTSDAAIRSLVDAVRSQAQTEQAAATRIVQQNAARAIITSAKAAGKVLSSVGELLADASAAARDRALERDEAGHELVEAA
jgi:hypothetical protein